MRKRNHTVTIRMNKAEYDLFQSKVKESGRTQQEVVIKARKQVYNIFFQIGIRKNHSFVIFMSSEISFAVAVTIRMPLSLISSRRASSCRHFVSFPVGVSKRNWSTDIL